MNNEVLLKHGSLTALTSGSIHHISLHHSSFSLTPNPCQQARTAWAPKALPHPPPEGPGGAGSTLAGGCHRHPGQVWDSGTEAKPVALVSAAPEATPTQTGLCLVTLRAQACLHPENPGTSAEGE